MNPSESVAAFEDSVEASGSSLLDLVPRTGVEQMFGFYASTRAAACAGPEEDMLLFEWGTYDWGEGKLFELSISRQFIELGAQGEPELSQLRLIFKYSPDAELAALGEGNRWCHSRSELAEFGKFVRANAAFQVVAERESPSVRLSHEYI